MPRRKQITPQQDDERKDKLTPSQLQKLVNDICHSNEQEEEEARAVALMILVDELEQKSGFSPSSMIVKRAAFTMCMTECLDAQIDLVRAEYSYS
jgi:hypothetical protein